MKKQQQPFISNQVAEIELVYRSKIKAADRPIIKKSSDIVDLLRSHWNLDTIELFEEFKVLYLNRANKVIGIYPVSAGGLTGTVADVRLIVVAALRLAACSMVLAHNHPSGTLAPSRADEELTQKIKHGCSYLDIKVLDHIILTKDAYLSFSDEGLL